MRRLSLSTKLFAAALPLIIAIGALLAISVRSDLEEIDRAEHGAELGGIWEPLIASLTAIEVETDAIGATAPDMSARRATDQAVNDVRASIENLGAFEAASDHVTAGRSALSAARRNVDMAAIAPTMVGDVDPIDAYAAASRELVAVGQLLPSEAGDAELGQELLAIVKLAEAKLHANDVANNMAQWPNEDRDTVPIAQAQSAFAQLQTTLGEFEAIAPDEWSTEFRQSGFGTELGSYGTELSSVARAADAGEVETFDVEGFEALIDEGVAFQSSISQSIVADANMQVEETRTATMIRIGIILGAVLIGLLIAWLITRSVTRRVKAVSNGANQVAEEQLPALVEALRDPRGKAVLPDIEPVNAKGGDDLADLAKAFNSMQETLIDVAHQQVEVLRRGVSDIFVTMARRNRSLIDRQLAMLDEFEAGVEDPEVLSNYYQLDHLSTRMRRNSESLLVLANAEPKRRRLKATEIDDVVRASIGEVEDYRRIEIQNLESLQVKGTVVADVSHLLAELLDNATSFSPPGSVVRVGGRRTGDSYMIRIVDDGVGAAPDRIEELNELLREPPIVGLSVEATLGMSVVSLLANKHGIKVTLSAGSPGMTVDVVLPGSVFGPMDAPAVVPTMPASEPGAAPVVASVETPAAAPTPIEPTYDPGPLTIDADALSTLSETPAQPTPTAQTDTAEPALPTRNAEPVADAPVQPTPEPQTDATGPALPTRNTEPVVEAPVVEAPVAEAPVAEAPVAEEAPVEEAPNLPPPSAGEFDVPPAPPITANGLAQRPVTPDTARPAPDPTPAVTPEPALPTRSQRGTGPQGPDRLAPAAQPADDAPVGTTEPGALQAALSAFDTGRNAVSAEPAGALPTRDRGLEAPSAAVEEESAVAQSRIDPDALRNRLRAFTSEFSNANNGDHDINDHEGDPR